MPHSAILTSPDERAIARLLRADPAEVQAFALGLPEQRRAHLALFCHARTHYRDLGLLLARACSRHALANAGGYAGEFLADQAARPVVADDASAQRRRPPITLARAGTIAALASSAAS